jgi:hypothetical protein
MKDMADIAATQKQDVCIGALRQLFGQVYSGVEAAGTEGFPACGQLKNPWRMHLAVFWVSARKFGTYTADGALV